MSVEILVFDDSKEATQGLIHTIRHVLNDTVENIKFTWLKSSDVFTENISEKAQIVFFTLANMYDVEAARKLSNFHNEISLIIVSDSEEYGTMSWSLGAIYYLLRPISEVELKRALEKCKDSRQIKIS